MLDLIPPYLGSTPTPPFSPVPTSPLLPITSVSLAGPLSGKQAKARHTLGPGWAGPVRQAAEGRNSWENLAAETAWDRWVGQRRGVSGNGSGTHSSTLFNTRDSPGTFPTPQIWKRSASNKGTDDKDEEDESSYVLLSTCCEHMIPHLLLKTIQGGRRYFSKSPMRGLVCPWSYTYKWQNGVSNPSTMDSKPSFFKKNF